MGLENLSDELAPGRLFIHARLNDPMTGGPLYCRIRAVDGNVVEFETIYHREDGSERIGAPWRPHLGSFIEEIFGGWYQETSPPPSPPSKPRGQPVPMDPRKIGGRPAGD